MAKDKAAKADDAQTVEALLLRDCTFGLVGEIVTLSANDAEQGQAAGMIDTHPDALAYAKSIKE